MEQPKIHHTAKELAGLPGMPSTESAVIRRAKKESWPSQPRAGRGGGREYPLTTLPAETRDHLMNALIAALPEKLCPLPAVSPGTALVKREKAQLPAIETLEKWRRECMDARMVFMRLIERAVASDIGVNRAINTIAGQAQNGTLPAEVARFITLANQRSGKDTKKRTLSYDGMMKWWSLWVKNGKNPIALAPKGVKKLEEITLRHYIRDYPAGKAALVAVPAAIPPWLTWFLDEYRKFTKPSLADAHRTLRRTLPRDIPYPTVDKVRRICNQIPLVLLEKGRMTGAEYKSILGYAERDAREFDPMTICQIDGHSFKAYVAHPTTGAHFHPEVCGVICLTTKILAGWSWGLAESWRTVADAYRHACTVTEEKPWGGVTAILEADRGAGNMAGVNSDDIIGMFARVGTTFIPPEQGGNPQGHGAVERSNQSIWIRAAKQLCTYTGKDMDRVARKRVYIQLEKDLKKAKNEGKLGMTKTSELLLAPDEFTAFLLDTAIAYNNTPHSALPRITAPPPGYPDERPRRRNMTPFEALAERRAQGWEPVAPLPEMLPYLFMPHERIRVRREKFTLRGNTYHAYELHNYHLREDLIAAYDIHDAENVWVLDPDERPICTAKWNGNRVHAQPVPVVQQAVMERENRRTKNLENKLEMVRGEADSAIEVAPTHIELPPEVLAGEARREELHQQKVVSLAQSKKLRDVSSSLDVYYLILGRITAGTVTPYQVQWKKDFEYWEENRKKVGLLKDDPYCLHDPEEQKDRLKTEG